MADLNHILVPIDFSANSKNALAYAVEMAERTGARLSLMHSYRLMEKKVKPKKSPSYSIKKELDRDYRQQLDQIEEEYFNQRTVKHEYLLEIGFIIDAIKMLSLTRPFDLVVMGTRGSHNVDGSLGSTTTGVIKKINRPVLAIPENAKFKGIKKVAFTGDPKVPNPEIINMLNKVLQLFSADLYLLNTTGQNSKEGYDLSEKLGTVKGSIELKSDEKAADDISNFLDKEDIDMLSMIAFRNPLFQKLFGGGYEEHSPLHSRVPILAMPN